MTTELSPYVERDEALIIADLEDRYIEEFVYSFQQGGKTVTGLSWKGVQEAAREMGGIQVPMEKVKIDETETHVHVIVEAIDSNRDASRLGSASQPKQMTVKGKQVDDPFAYQKAISKAQRNAMMQLIPQTVIKAWVEQRLETVSSSAPRDRRRQQKPDQNGSSSDKNATQAWTGTAEGQNMVSKAKELFPEPETPVITTSLFLGITRSMFLRLCSRAPLIELVSGMTP